MDDPKLRFLPERAKQVFEEVTAGVPPGETKRYTALVPGVSLDVERPSHTAGIFVLRLRVPGEDRPCAIHSTYYAAAPVAPDTVGRVYPIESVAEGVSLSVYTDPEGGNFTVHHVRQEVLTAFLGAWLLAIGQLFAGVLGRPLGVLS